MKNFTISFICIRYSYFSINNKNNYIIFNSNFQNFFKPIFTDFFKLCLYSCNFYKSLNSIIFINNNFNGIIFTNYLTNSNLSLVINYCSFININSGSNILLRYSVSGGDLILSNTLFYNCTSTSQSVGLLANCDYISINNCCFKLNYCQVHTQAIDIEKATYFTFINHTTLSENSPKSKKGQNDATYIRNIPTLLINNINISECHVTGTSVILDLKSINTCSIFLNTFINNSDSSSEGSFQLSNINNNNFYFNNIIGNQYSNSLIYSSNNFYISNCIFQKNTLKKIFLYSGTII